MTCMRCGAETIVATTPGGRRIELAHGKVYVKPGEPWPTRIYAIAPATGRAVPALELRADGRPAGPYLRQHRCTDREPA